MVCESILGCTIDRASTLVFFSWARLSNDVTCRTHLSLVLHDFIEDLPHRLREKFGRTASNYIWGVLTGSVATGKPDATDEMYEDVGDPGESNLSAGSASSGIWHVERKGSCGCSQISSVG